MNYLLLILFIAVLLAFINLMAGENGVRYSVQQRESADQRSVDTIETVIAEMQKEAVNKRSYVIINGNIADLINAKFADPVIEYIEPCGQSAAQKGAVVFKTESQQLLIFEKGKFWGLKTGQHVFDGCKFSVIAGNVRAAQNE